MAIGAPQPAVFHLPTLFRQITNGDIRIPAFQRSYIWKQSQVTDLLSSVREAYPVGSLLLWQVDRKMLELASKRATTFPDVPEIYPTSYVLDGMQRLTSLYGVFHFSDGDDPRLDVVYDLRIKRFYNSLDIDEGQREACIPMASFLSPRKMLAEQARLASLTDGDTLLEEMLITQAAFQEYLLPIVTIRSDDVQRIVGIFERTNSTGTRLDTVDFMRAITWDQQFDLNEHLTEVHGQLQDNDLDLADDTIIKCIGLLLGVDPTSEGLLSLRNSAPDRLRAAFIDFLPAVQRVSRFLREKLDLLTFEHVPYEGQVLVAFKAIGMQEIGSTNELGDIARWFWATGFNESLRGKPDHYVTRAVNDWRGLLAGRIRGLEPRLRLSADDFGERRMIRGRALSSTFIAMFAAGGAIDLISHERVDTTSYLSDTSTAPFDTVFSLQELRAAGLSLTSPRIFSNLVVKDQLYEIINGPSSFLDAIDDLVDSDRVEILSSQFISLEAAKAAVSGDVLTFLKLRSKSLYSAAQLLVDFGSLDGNVV